jgi:hypothetical protein
MTAQDIIARIVEMHKYHTAQDVVELLASRAAISDLPMIRDELLQHRSSNERNAADDACDWIFLQIG